MIRMSPSAAAMTSVLALAVLASIQPAQAQGGPGFGQPGFGPPAPQQSQQQAGEIEQFRQTLQQFGTFQNHPRYGEVWTPNPGVTQPGWRPYPPCHWTYDRQQQAWYYNDQTPWGQIVHHHGRWANDPAMGWMWIGDANFGPGWVVWRAEANTVSWAAMLPEQDGQQEPPAEHWHTQDTATFNASCRQAGPAPVARMPAPVMGAPVMPVAAPGPVIVGRPPVIVGRPPVVVIPPGRPDCRLVFPRPWWCRPVVRPDPRPCRLIFPRPWWCRPIVRPDPRPCHFIFPRPIWCRPIVRPPHRPCIMIYPRPAHCGGIGRPFPRRPFPPIVRPHRPFPPIVRPHRPGRPIVRPGRPGRPVISRPFPGRPGITRPFPGRPGIHRPFPGRPSLGMGGGFRPQLGGFGRGGAMRIGRR